MKTKILTFIIATALFILFDGSKAKAIERRTPMEVLWFYDESTNRRVNSVYATVGENGLEFVNMDIKILGMAGDRVRNMDTTDVEIIIEYNNSEDDREYFEIVYLEKILPKFYKSNKTLQQMKNDYHNSWPDRPEEEITSIIVMDETYEDVFAILNISFDPVPEDTESRLDYIVVKEIVREDGDTLEYGRCGILCTVQSSENNLDPEQLMNVVQNNINSLMGNWTSTLNSDIERKINWPNFRDRAAGVYDERGEGFKAKIKERLENWDGIGINKGDPRSVIPEK